MEESRLRDPGISRVDHRIAAWLAWSLCALSLVLMALSLWLVALNHSHPNTITYAPWLDNTLSALSYAPVGALVASRRPDNPIGWLVCLYGFVISLSYFGAEYVIYALLAEPGSLPAGEALAWVLSWILPVVIGLSIFPLLLFPTGRLPSRRWRWLAWLSAVWMLLTMITGAFASGALLGVLGPIENPVGIDGLTGAYTTLLLFVSPLLTTAAALSLLVRFRRAVGVQRQQIKWFAYAAVATVSASTLAYIIPGVIDTPLWFERAGFVLNAAFVPAIPISIGIAILRYRLYDIDIIINRTLVYGSLTVALVLVYFGGVAATQTVFRALTGHEQQSQLAVVVSTLAIAALFNPVRRHIQSFIDQRFYRQKYDARMTLEAFSAKLRDETDLDSLSEELISVVLETMRPEHVSLWLRPGAMSGDRRVRR
jgi:uncharacterized membrane protein YhdT